MKLIRVTYFALVAFLSGASCSKETPEPNVYDWADGNIYFKTSLATVTSTRAEDMTLDDLESFQVTCFNTGDITKDEEEFVAPYFEDATFIRQESPLGVTYVSSPFEEPRTWPTSDGLLKFFAFSPSRSVMARGNAGITGASRGKYFSLINNSTETNSIVEIDYKLAIVRVNPDISKQFDFVTAETSGERWKDFITGVDLAFRHQMSQVELRAWGNRTDYNFEIAGVRLGNPVVEGTYDFSATTNSTSSGRWLTDLNAFKDKVEYLYRGSDASESDILENGDIIYKITNTEHNTLETAESIMGRGGCAMVIPTVNPKWEGLTDPNIGNQPYFTARMYFSILMRVSSAASGKQIYPYPGNPQEMTVIYYAVDNSGAIITRVYPDESKEVFFTDSNLQQQYVVPDGVEIKEFGWAAVPVDANWSAGNRYIYTLNYSEGIGLHDPQDPEPGTPIQGQPTISWGVSVDTWNYASKNEDYNPDVDVP